MFAPDPPTLAQPAPIAAAPDPVAKDAGPRVQAPLEALARDAGEYARRYGVSPGEALRRLMAQQESVAATDAIGREFQERLAGIAIEHGPAYRIVVLLTGGDPVPDRQVFAGGMIVPVVFRTGAPATRARILDAIRDHQRELRDALPSPPGMGVDARTGMLAVTVRRADIDADDVEAGGGDALAARLGAIAGVPVEIAAWDDANLDMSVEGGGRVIGRDAADGGVKACTTGFVVTDGARTGVVTAAHCPDDLAYVDAGRGRVPLGMVGAWGAAYQDVQIHIAVDPGDAAMPPLFLADAAKTLARPLTSWRNRASTRAGDIVCHRGERTGYSCAEILFVDYAPPGDLCAGPCPATWVAVKGPDCRGGDSGGPVFSGTVAFGIVKGGSYAHDGGCRLYYYMSTDYLPPTWTLLHR